MQQSNTANPKKQKTPENQQKLTFHTIASSFPKKDRNEANKQQAQQKEKQTQNARTERKSEEERLLLQNTKTTSRKVLGLHLEKAEESTEGRRSKNSQSKRSRKNTNRRHSLLFIGGQPLGKPNAQTTPSLKRHAAWEYPESAAHHKCLFWLPHPHSPRGPTRPKVDSGFKNQLFFNPLIFSKAK